MKAILKGEISQDIRLKSLGIWKKEDRYEIYGESYSKEHLDDLKMQAERIRKKCDLFLLIGVGGSNGAARAVIEGFHRSGVEGGPEIRYVGNGLSPRQIAQTLSEVEKKEVCLNIIAKNFKTLEPGSHFRVFREALEKKYGKEEAAKRIVVTGSIGSRLEEIANEEGYTFFAFDTVAKGRFSGFSNVGLFPMAVAGIDIDQFLSGCKEMQMEMQEEDHFLHDYVAYRHAAYKNGYKIEVLSAFDLDFREWLKWWVQLYGESEGKQKLGLYPDGMCFSEDLHSMGQFLQDGSPIVIETFLRVANYESAAEFPLSRVKDEFEYLEGKNFAAINRIMEEATMEAHIKEGIPCFALEMESFTVKEWGKMMAFFMAAITVSCRLIEVNPFDQDGVEKYKRIMFDKLQNIEKYLE